jgi:glycerophosphoryl diester phosphodiesterase
MRFLSWFLAAATAVVLLVGAAWQSSVSEERTILTSAHRGEHHRHPENSLPAIQAAIDAGVDYVELDIRTTADGQLVLMHDATVNRMTDGKGKVTQMTFDEIRALDLGVRFPGQFPGLKVPSFDEALDLANKGGIGIYVHSKRAAPQQLVDAIERHQMGERVLFFADNESDPHLLPELSRLRPGWKVMPEAFNPAHVRDLMETLRPTVLAFDNRDFDDPTITAARQAKVDIFVDRLANNPKAWQDAVDRGAAGIQTDYPAELVAYLRSKKYHK